MKNKIRCCLRILLAKRYAVFTAETKGSGEQRHFNVNNATASFLIAISSHIWDNIKERKDACEMILNEIENERRSN